MKLGPNNLAAMYVGGTSITSAYLGAVTVYLTGPAAPAVTLASPTSLNDVVTYDPTVNVSGIEAGATWEYTTNGGVTWNAGAGTSFELAQGVYADGDVQVRQTDISGNVSALGDLGDVQVAISLEGVIGSDGITEFTGGLIHPVEVMINGVTRTFYFWDRDGNGVANIDDRSDHHLLDNLFNNGSDTTDAEATRSLLFTDGDGNERTLLIPTINGDEGYTTGLKSGTSVSSGTENQTTYDGLLAIWDAHNGDGTGAAAIGVPNGWVSSYYWSATSTNAGSHARLGLNNGFATSSTDTRVYYVALEVV